MDEIERFSKMHQLDDRKTFQESWKKWTEEEEQLIDSEVERLNELGIAKERKDIIEKMYVSARFYYRKKKAETESEFESETKSNDKTDKKPNSKYICLRKEMLDAMDRHLSNKSRKNKNEKPSESYNTFCIIYEDLLNEERRRLHDQYENEKQINDKFKKTYKNRYFSLQKQA